MMTSRDAVDAILHDAALADAERGRSTPQQKRIALQVRGAVQVRLAELRRGLLPAVEPPVKARPIPPSLLVLGRDALVARLEALTRARGGAIQYAHRNLAGLSDDDLRRLIDLLETDATVG
jgi:hypothetical protein